MKYAHPKCTGCFLGGETRDYPIISGYTNKYNPIIGKVWECLGRPFTLSKRSGVRFEIAVDVGCITAYRTVHSRFTDSDWIDLDSITVTNGLLRAFGGPHELNTKTVRCRAVNADVNITFASDDNIFYIAVNRDVAMSLSEIAAKHWDIPVSACDYTVVDHIVGFDINSSKAAV